MPIQIPPFHGHLKPLQWSLPGFVQELKIHSFDRVLPSHVPLQKVGASPQDDMLTQLLVSGFYLFPLSLPLLG